jgi:hypothetical protein
MGPATWHGGTEVRPASPNLERIEIHLYIQLIFLSLHISRTILEGAEPQQH